MISFVNFLCISVFVCSENEINIKNQSFIETGRINKCIIRQSYDNSSKKQMFFGFIYYNYNYYNHPSKWQL